jgi:hypothetical protein
MPRPYREITILLKHPLKLGRSFPYFLTSFPSFFILHFSSLILHPFLMSEPIPAITLPPAEDPQQEGEWLKNTLHQWLDQEFIPEPVNGKIAERAAQVFVRQRMEGENDIGSLVIAIVTEMQSFDFSKSFYSEFAVANAISDLLLESLGIDRCCGQ